MPGKQVVGVFCDFRREGNFFSIISGLFCHTFDITDEGEYVAPRCTVFGLEKDEIKHLIEKGFKLTDHHKDEEGYECETSAYRLMRELGKTFGFELHGNAVCTDAPGDRKTLVYTLVKEN